VVLVGATGVEAAVAGTVGSGHSAVRTSEEDELRAVLVSALGVSGR